MSFTDSLAAACNDSWQRMHEHPFVREIGEGVLAEDKFVFYLRQDYVYLIEYSRLLALACAKAPDLETMRYFKDLLGQILESEMELHVKICAEYGLSRSVLESTVAAPGCLAYTSFLLSTAYSGSFADLLAVMLPCVWGYHEIGQRLQRQGLPQAQFYRDWIEIYASDQMKNISDCLRQLMEAQARHSDGAAHERWKNLFARSVEFEVLFWEMSWRKLDSALG
ncbi:thiaminase II [bacterium]|nr:thiaminase II [bacterium]